MVKLFLFFSQNINDKIFKKNHFSLILRCMIEEKIKNKIFLINHWTRLISIILFIFILYFKFFIENYVNY